MRTIDLRSDTVTLPSPEMRRAIGEAELGDDVFGDDPTVNRLEAMAAQVMGKEAALLTTSGTQSNLAAMLAHCQRGDEVIWRTELWYFRYFYGGWERVGNVERVLERHRISESKWRRITKVYYPALSARVDQNGRSKPVKFVLPDPLDPATGRIAGTDPVQKTTPIILGLRKKPDVAPTPKIRR
ncbi:hypothetical protein LCGC14_2486210 [marine sediment metagenome]|uniref:Aromatic amino acid beta-eliminating lyase/threonine aldolase domain-containing protein n=1 Tax=marine sediment metagenome TaxID=412755 RepID=A0A0F9B620_9ZZZZ